MERKEKKGRRRDMGVRKREIEISIEKLSRSEKRRERYLKIRIKNVTPVVQSKGALVGIPYCMLEA